MKTILITGGTGFIGKNLIAKLEETNSYKLLKYTRETSNEELKSYITQADFIVHLAGVSRPKDTKEFYEGNSDLTKKLIGILLEKNLNTPIFYTSSILAVLDNDFGKSKRLAEEVLLKYNEKTGANIYILRLTNTFGRLAKPNAHSVIATFCYNISHNLEISISDKNREMILAYIDDVILSITNLINGEGATFMEETEKNYYKISKTYTKTLGEISTYLIEFKKGDEFDNKDEFINRLQITYESYKD